MGKAMFYHLTRDPVEVTASTLLTRAFGAGWRVVVRGGDMAGLERLDAALWLGAKDSFLPHGLAGGPHDADQPILLTTAHDAPNNPVCAMAVDRAEVDPADVAGLERLWILFDGQDEAAVVHARTQWKAMAAAGVQAEYWSQDGGAWAKKAQSGEG
ncbi:DNA polymerase III subunit chi [Roseibaca sp. V10]|uniref:DNA polymerase III subunit chi n=1 Tax=Roseinatronobacter domitianus TaxID=2940293 RepID=A0ABT0LXA1_9RHOB|nr:DNA polymerase III subunit chi [Roseibaca domitiana]MCL1627242.1 DNA polymerase III subunit chi [Roseibaca domitiana]